MKDGTLAEMVKPGPATPVPAGTRGEIRNFDPARGWEIEWETGVSTFFPGSGDEITTHAKPGQEQCDFCPAREARWEHRCGDSQNVMVAFDGSGVQALGQGSHGSWAACEACHRLIEAGKRDKLARRCAKRIIAGEGGGLPMSVVLVGVRQAHAMYWKHRVGPGFPIRQPQSQD